MFSKYVDHGLKMSLQGRKKRVMCGFCNVWVCVDFVICGCVCVDFVMCGCVCVNFVMCGYVWIL